MRARNSKEEAFKRLACSEGHLKGIRMMVAADVYCGDILQQSDAVQRAT
jgi:DNA-binding FrmR family transcriptional regulator